MVINDDNRLAMSKVNQKQLRKVLVPVPPLAEQKRIVARVDELMGLCNEMEKLIRQRQAKARRFADSVVHAASSAEFGGESAVVKCGNTQTVEAEMAF